MGIQPMEMVVTTLAPLKAVGTVQKQSLNQIFSNNYVEDGHFTQLDIE